MGGGLSLRPVSDPHWYQEVGSGRQSGEREPNSCSLKLRLSCSDREWGGGSEWKQLGAGLGVRALTRPWLQPPPFLWAWLCFPPSAGSLYVSCLDPSLQGPAQGTSPLTWSCRFTAKRGLLAARPSHTHLFMPDTIPGSPQVQGLAVGSARCTSAPRSGFAIPADAQLASLDLLELGGAWGPGKGEEGNRGTWCRWPTSAPHGGTEKYPLAYDHSPGQSQVFPSKNELQTNNFVILLIISLLKIKVFHFKALVSLTCRSSSSSALPAARPCVLSQHRASGMPEQASRGCKTVFSPLCFLDTFPFFTCIEGDVFLDASGC